MRFQHFQPGPWTCAALAVGLIIALHLAIPWVLPVDDRSPYRSPYRWHALQARADQRITVEMDNVAIQNALARISKASGVDILVDWEALAEFGKRPSTPVFIALTHVPARRAVADVLLSAGISYKWVELDRHGRIVISNRIETVTRRYEGRTPTHRDGHFLADAGQSWVAPDTWDGPDARGWVTVEDGTLVIEHTYQTHMLIEHNLQTHRQLAGPLPLP